MNPLAFHKDKKAREKEIIKMVKENEEYSVGWEYSKLGTALFLMSVCLFVLFVCFAYLLCVYA